MSVKELITIQLRLFILKALPEQLPYSRALVAVLTVMFFVIKTFSNLWFIEIIKVYDKKLQLDLSLSSSALIIAVYLLILFASVRSLLTYYNVSDRATKVIAAFLTVDLIFSIIGLGWLLCLSYIPLPLQPGSIFGIIIILVFVMILYWQFMVYIHIIFKSLDITLLRAGVYALVYMMVQHNVSEMLMSILLKGERIQ